MSEFLDDIRSQASLLGALLEDYRGRLRPQLERASDLIGHRPDRPVLLTGMGSSLFAGTSLAGMLARRGRIALVEDAGELLHYGLGTLAGAGVLVVVSQSGRSYETVRVVEEARSAGGLPIVAVVNDETSPLARAADVVLPMLAGSEGAISSKTYLASLAVLLLLGDTGGGTIDGQDLERAIEFVDEVARDGTLGREVADHLGPSDALVLVGRGPSLGVAQYGALAIKEAAAMPAEAMSGGAFRHGPIELAGGSVGIVVLAPAGKTTDLLVTIATETAGLGMPTWLVTTAASAPTGTPPTLRVSPILPDLAEDVSALAIALPVQLAAAALADRAGRPGTTLLAPKVTDRE